MRGHRILNSLSNVRRGFTLVEILIVVLILGVLAGLVLPHYQNMGREARAKSQAANVRKVREMIQIHRNSGLYPLTASGFPTEIFEDWFRGNRLPDNAWTLQAMIVDTVAEGDDAVYPESKTFDATDPTAPNAWYNTDNGQFHALVVDQGDDALTLELFNTSNSTQAESLDQTTW